MYCVRVYSIIFLCLLTTKCSVSDMSEEQKTKIKDAIDRLVKIENVENDQGHLDPYLSKVKISGNYQTMILYMYRPDVSTPNTVYLINVLYVSANCKFADWTKNMLYILVKDFPLLYHSRFLNSEFGYVNGQKLKETYTNLENIDLSIDRFMNILLTLTNVAPNVLSNEKFFLKTLFKLKFKIYYFKSLYDARDRSKTNVRIDNDLIRVCLKAINSIQKFMITNCYENAHTHEKKLNKRLYGYSIDVTEDARNSINGFLKDVEPIKLEDYFKTSCNVEHFLLDNIVAEGSQEDQLNVADKISKEIRSASVIHENKYISMKTIIGQVKEPLYNIEIIFWYQKYVLTTITKLIYLKTLPLLKEENETDDKIKLNIKSIHDQLKSTNVPSDLIEFFFHISNAISEKVSFNVLYDQVEEKISKIKNVIVSSNPSITLQTFMNEILKYHHDLHCFNELQILLKTEYDSYYLPYIEDTNKQLYIQSAIVKHNNILDNRCMLVKSLYSICYEITVYLNNTFNVTLTDRQPFYDNIFAEIDKIKGFLLRVIKLKIPDADLLMMSYDIIIILINQNFKPFGDYYIPNFRRFVNLIVTELNDYGIKYCSLTPKFGYKFFIDVDFNEIGKTLALSERIRRDLRISLEEFHDELPDYSYFDLNHLFKNFIENSHVVHKYKNIIQFYWKGEKHNIEDIYVIALSVVTLNSRHFYEIYDIYFKFYLAIFFYEINKFFKFYEMRGFNKLEGDEAISFKKKIDQVSNTYFPDWFWPFLTDLREFANYIVSSTITAQLENARMTHYLIKKKMIESRIIIEYDAEKNTDLTSVTKADGSICKKCQPEKFPGSVDDISVVVNDIIKNVSEFLKKFNLIIDRN